MDSLNHIRMIENAQNNVFSTILASYSLTKQLVDTAHARQMSVTWFLCNVMHQPHNGGEMAADSINVMAFARIPRELPHMFWWQITC